MNAHPRHYTSTAQPSMQEENDSGIEFRLLSPLAHSKSDEGYKTERSSLRLSLKHAPLTFAIASDSESDLRFISFIGDDDLSSQRDSLPQDFEESEDLGEDNDDGNFPKRYFALEPYPLRGPEPPYPLVAPSPLPPHSETSSTFAFFQNHFLRSSRILLPRHDNDSASTLSSPSCYSCPSEPNDAEDRQDDDGKLMGNNGPSLRTRQTVISSTLGGLDVYMRSGSILHWTHHPQYAARIGHQSQGSFLRELSGWDNQFEFDPVTPFARDWFSSKAGSGKEEDGDPSKAGRRANPTSPQSISESISTDWETVQAPSVESEHTVTSTGTSNSCGKRLKKRRHPISPENASKGSLRNTKAFSAFRTRGRFCSKSPGGSLVLGPRVELLFPRPDLRAFTRSEPTSPSIRSMKSPSRRRGVGSEAWVWVDGT